MPDIYWGWSWAAARPPFQLIVLSTVLWTFLKKARLSTVTRKQESCEIKLAQSISPTKRLPAAHYWEQKQYCLHTHFFKNVFFSDFSSQMLLLFVQFDSCFFLRATEKANREGRSSPSPRCSLPGNRCCILCGEPEEGSRSLDRSCCPPP